MQLTREKLISLKPCEDGLIWYDENIKTEDLLEVLIQCNNYRPDWARWLFTELMTKKQCIEIAIYSAESVLHIFEEKYPEDKRPRQAIEAAKRYLENPSKENRAAVYAAREAASAASAERAAYAAYAVWEAASAERAAAWAASAAWAAAWAAEYAAREAASAAAWAASAALAALAAAWAVSAADASEKIIYEAVRILEEKQ